jgi:hypothetical protein
MVNELVFTVEGSTAHTAKPISLAEAGLRERQHLQEWVLAHPEMLGTGVMIITSEFDRWESRSGAERDRLDVLGLGADGRLVVAELKRDAAPDTVEMQAIKYAAMASRFDLDVLVAAHVEFVSQNGGEALTSEQAKDAIHAHTQNTITEETLRSPKIVLVAGSFPPPVAASAVWLSEMGLDITLTQVQAYQLPTGFVITVSQLYPLPEIEDFLVAPTRAARRARDTVQLPTVDWTAEDLERLRTEVADQTIQTTMNLCAAQPGIWIPAEAIQAETGRAPAKHRGDYGGFAITLRSRFTRSNAPFDIGWAAGGTSQQYYKVSDEVAALWAPGSLGLESGTDVAG